jgi:DNA-binding response OmpR family regulator
MSDQPAGGEMRGIKKILVVEDETLLAEAISNLLLEADFEPVGPARTVDQAMGVLRTASIDAAILDIRLIGGVSFPLAYALRQRRLPFLFLTAYRRRDLPLDLQGEQLIEKPFKPSTLIQVLHELLPLPSEASTVPTSPSTRVVAP